MILDFFRQLFSGSAPPAPTPVASFSFSSSPSLSPAEGPKKKRQWTIMVYMTGNNGLVLKDDGTPLLGVLEDVGRANIEAMKKAGATDEVAVLVQFNAKSDTSHTYRHIIYPASGVAGGAQSLRMPIQDMGSATSLSDFIIWGMNEAPAEQVAVVLWGHGTGWEEKDIYAYADQQKVTLAAGQDEVRFMSQKEQLLSGLFLSSAVQIMGQEEEKIRGICYDDSSMTFLDNAALQQAFRDAEDKTGQKVNLIGMDACLMSMLEVAYQLRKHGEVMVSSQADVPSVGWPYEPILQDLSKRPTMSAKELGSLIVQEYGQSDNASITLSAIDLARVPTLSKALGQVAHELCRGLAEKDKLLEIALFRAQRYVTRFQDENLADLRHFLSLLRQEYEGNDAALINALHNALLILSSVPERSPVLASVAKGWGTKNAHGLSIYCPSLGCSPFYNRLDFDEVGWRTFIHRLNRVESPV